MGMQYRLYYVLLLSRFTVIKIVTFFYFLYFYYVPMYSTIHNVVSAHLSQRHSPMTLIFDRVIKPVPEMNWGK